MLVGETSEPGAARRRIATINHGGKTEHMNNIQLVGQVITCTNYTTPRIFNFNPEPVRKAAEDFLAAGISDIEIPVAVVDPDNRSETGCDEETLKRTLAELPAETVVIATYLGGGKGDAAYVDSKKRALDHLVAHFPDMKYAALHPAGTPETIRETVDAYVQLADHAASLREGFQLCFHNHYDSNAETAAQVRAFLSAMDEVNHPALRWGPDTGHCHGMGEEYLDVLNEYAHLIGDYFHIKARVPAFDRLHGDDYREERDIWSNKAEFGRGLYGGFVNAADPEMATPFNEIFKVIREKARPTDGLVRGAVEIDIPRQHPRLEVLCATLYFKNVHGIQGAQALSNDDIIARVFKTRK